MVLTVTINPLLERKYFLPFFVNGSEYRSLSPIFNVGGKGINVSRQLKMLDVDSLIFTILGGENGKKIRHLLTKEEINFTAAKTVSETREATLLIETEKNSVTTLFSDNNIITETETNEVINKLDKMIQNCEIVVLSGSSPSVEADRIFPELIRIANNYDKISVIDTYGRHLEKCINESPTILHNNLSEINYSLNRNLHSENDIQEFLDFLYSKGIKQSFITNGASTVYCSKADFHYKITPSKINVKDATGSGDAFVAGIVYGHYNDLIFDDSLKTAVALGVINAQTFDVCKVNLNNVKDLISSLQVYEIGKKMKTIDVS
jgi:1-phosphofructokinase family hexose kinase